MFRSLHLSQDGHLRMDLNSMDIAFALQDLQGVLWVDFESTTPETDEPILQKTFGFHPLAIDDALKQTHVPRVDDWGQYLYIVSQAITFDPINIGLETLELDIFIGKNYIVTHHDQPIEAITRTWTAIQRDERHLRHGSDHLLYRILAEVVAGYMPVVENLDTQIDKLEEQIFNQSNSDTLQGIFVLKRAVLNLRRIIDPQREVLNRLARDDYANIDANERVYFRDVYDHLVRLHDLTETIRDLVSGSMDTHLSMTNNRMNEIMKTLTIITTLFMPLSFLVGFFGMNFFVPLKPLWVWVTKPVFIITLLITLMTPFTMYFWMRKRGWM